MTNEIKKEFIEKQCECEKNPEKWAKYLNAEYSYVLKVDEYYLPIEKERTKKSFCFGHGQNGISTEEEAKGAFESARNARINENYFLNENLQGINEKLLNLKYFLLEDEEEKEKYYNKHHNELNYSIKFENVYLSKNYAHKVSYLFATEYDIKNKPWFYKNLIRKLTKKEISEIVETLEKEKKDFQKRLNTYLKRYGLSKIHSWTYLVD